MEGIGLQMKKGLVWTAIDKYSNFFISLAISMVLARLLPPHDFGVVATATVLLAFLTMMANFGIGPAIIQRKDLSQSDLDNIFSFTILVGLVLGGISFISSWPISCFYDNPELKPVVQVLSVGLFLTCINVVPSALMSKNLRFREMATRSVAFNLIFGIIGIIAAFYGAGVYALICPQIISSFFTFLYNNHFQPVRLSGHFTLDPIKRIFSYSFYVLLTNFTTYLNRNLDKLIIGKALSADSLGYYDKSYRLMQMPMTYVSSVITPVMQPVLSSLQNNMTEMSNKYKKIISLIASLSFPIAAILFFSAEDLIFVFYGENWLPAVESFKILALSVPVVLISSPNGSMFMACNATKQLFICSIIGTSIFATSMAVAALMGDSIESFAWAVTVNEFIGICISYYILFARVMRQSIISILKVLSLPVVSLLILILIYLLYSLVVPISLPHIIHLFLKLSIGGLFILSYLKVTHQFDIIEFIRNKFNINKR